MGSNGSENFKRLLLLQVTTNFFFKFGIFEILKIEILMILFSFSLTWDPMGAKISKRYSYKAQSKAFWDPMGAKTSKRYSSLKSVLNPFFSNFFWIFFSSQWSSKKYCFGFLKFWVSDILTNFLNSPLYPMGKPKTSIYLLNERP